MEHIIQKLILAKNNSNSKNKKVFETWTLEEKKQLLELYLLISQTEPQIFSLIYGYHGCDSWEDIFRDFSAKYLKDKADGTQIAIDEINKQKNDII